MFGGDRLAFQAGAAPLPLFPIQGSIRIPDWAAQPWSNLHCKQNRPKLHSVTIREGLKNKHIFRPHRPGWLHETSPPPSPGTAVNLTRVFWTKGDPPGTTFPGGTVTDPSIRRWRKKNISLLGLHSNKFLSEQWSIWMTHYSIPENVHQGPWLANQFHVHWGSLGIQQLFIQYRPAKSSNNCQFDLPSFEEIGHFVDDL